MKMYMSDYTEKIASFWTNKVVVEKDRISFGETGEPYITTVDDRVYLVVPGEESIPFEAGKTFDSIIYWEFYSLNKVEGDVHRFRNDDLTLTRTEFTFVSYCTCKDGGACYECGVLDCGCIDVCRGRCGMRRW